MSRCVSHAPLLSRVAEGEASPEEAMRAARHLSDCTACRINLARERRLAAILEDGLEDPLPVGEDFVRAVMDNLPAEPPKPSAGLLALATGGWLKRRALGPAFVSRARRA